MGSECRVRSEAEVVAGRQEAPGSGPRPKAEGKGDTRVLEGKREDGSDLYRDMAPAGRTGAPPTPVEGGEPIRNTRGTGDSGRVEE